MQQTKTAHCTTLREFYNASRLQSNAAHGEHYCNYHDAIVRCMERGDQYKELGVFQGMSAAGACFGYPSRIELIDKSLEKFIPNEALFEAFCADNDIDLVTRQVSSSDPRSASDCDVLLVDSFHQVKHLNAELKIHAPRTRKFMIFHDTTKPNDLLYRALVAFARRNPWKVVERNELACGYTVLQRV